ncbi:TonB-dependent receptor [Draconibacterium sp. IB214405]|uniref:SusC/RagA family TonB-linked outer membrane protein n=1 Tax=Draconibacterium sp. IB214405 TaxID=3097352 RepID=UPI002A0AE653|nr:TonB-dependent receptor [Draconibacterium sp. IB214405]MDX8339598.1 TonB-dependent receptor [Draconibacterium sp. IB214405]
MNKKLNKVSKRHFLRALGLLMFFFLSTTVLYAQTVVSGTVKDESGPIPGANVVVKGTTNGVSTDVNGQFTIGDVPADGILVVSFIGYTQQEVAVDGRSTIDIILEETTTALDEVIVVGYGSMEKSNVTGAIATVNVADVVKTPVPNVVEALRGQVAGLQVTRGSGQPGSGVNFRIRGLNSLGGGSESVGSANQPIIVIDGVPMIGGNLSELNPDDIASINILKDAGAASIYGASGANGVILITTKKGKAGAGVVTVNANIGMVDLSHKLDVMDVDQYIQYRLDAQVTAGNTGATVNNILDGNELRNYIAGKSVDWQDELLRTGLQSNVSVAASGGSDKGTYYLSADMFTEEGIVQSSDYNRFSIRFNGDFTPTTWLKVGANVQMTKSFADETANAISEFNINGGFAPILPILINTPLGDMYDENGDLTYVIVDGQQFQINPLYRYRESEIDRKITRSYINPYVEIKLYQGLTYRLNTFAEDRQEFYGRFYSSDYQIPGGNNEAQIQNQHAETYLLDNILSYKNTFGKHSFDATAVYGFQRYKWEQFNKQADRMATDLLSYHAIDDSPTDRQTFSWDTDDWGQVYLVGRIGYSYDERYNATVTVRRDGSSKFGGNNKYGVFPSASVAWNMHNESFLESNKTIDFLKMRLSYGTMGNDRIRTFAYLDGASVTRGIVVNDSGEEQEVVGYGFGSLPNPDLKWEESQQINIGVDFGLFDSRLNGSVDYFKTTTKDLLLSEKIPIINGDDVILSNVGETQNTGLEISLNGDIVDYNGFTWTASVNWSKNNDKIISLTRGDVDADGNPIDNVANEWFIGENLSVIYNYDAIGIWQLGEEAEAAVYGAEPGDIKIRDIDDNGVIDQNDRSILGSDVTPDWYGGIRNTFSFKGFELDVLFETVQGIQRINNFYGSYTGRENELYINYWTPENPSNEFPAAGKFTGDYATAVKIQDASFVALRNVSLSYQLPSSILARTPFSAVSFSIRGNNLKYWTDYTDAYSPEAGRGAYPITRTWIFGTKISF